jgi:hypothetical protein
VLQHQIACQGWQLQQYLKHGLNELTTLSKVKLERHAPYMIGCMRPCRACALAIKDVRQQKQPSDSLPSDTVAKISGVPASGEQVTPVSPGNDTLPVPNGAFVVTLKSMSTLVDPWQ